VIDDFAQLDGWAADLLLDQNLGAAPGQYPGLPSSARCLFGPGYSLLRREVIEAANDRTDGAAESVGRILVTFGGSDPARLTPVALDAIDAAGLDGVTVTAIVGPVCPDLEAIRSQAGRMGIRTEIAIDPSDFARRLATADLAVSAAGSTCWELLALGTPAIVTAVSDNQIGVARGLSHAGAAVDMGRAGTWSTADLSRAIHDLVGDIERRRSMIDAGKEILGGNGAAKVVAAMQAITVRLKETVVSSS